jgi:hypothetical protein
VYTHRRSSLRPTLAPTGGSSIFFTPILVHLGR